MTRDIDAALVHWGDRLFYPGNRIVRGHTPRVARTSTRQRAAEIRARIAATVGHRVPQVMVKVTGGGRGMKAIAAHFRYISKNGRLEIEDERGQRSTGAEAVTTLADDWRLGGTLIDDVTPNRQAFNIMLSMPRGTDPLAVQRAAREFAQTELADHKYLMVLHDHQANPHVHLSVRAESNHGKRLNPRKADLQRWRETFAERLQSGGIECQATRPAARDRSPRDVPLWRIKASEAGRLRGHAPAFGAGRLDWSTSEAAEAWEATARTLASSSLESDRALARQMKNRAITPVRPLNEGRDR